MKELKHINWWDSLSDNERAIIKDYYGIGLLATDSQIEYVWVKEGEPDPIQTPEAGNTKTEREQALEWWDKLKDNQVRIDLKNTHYPNKSLLDVFKNSQYILQIWQQEVNATPNTQQRKEGEDIKPTAMTDTEWHKGYLALGADRMAWKKENEELKTENKRLLTTIDGLLETGSSRLTIRQFTDLKREMELLQDINRELLEGISEGITTLMSFEESNSWESRDGETLNKLSELLSKYTA